LGRSWFTAARIKAIFEGIVKILRVFQNDPIASGKAALMIGVALTSGAIIRYGFGQNTPFIVLFSAYLLFIIGFRDLIVQAGKWDKGR
jgi:hypothetical protein